jgi:hypothetical protein
VRFLGPAAATVTVTIARRVSERVFAERPVEVIGPAAAMVVPRLVEVTVIGPPEVVQALKPEQVVPRADLSKIDLKEQHHGGATAPVTVELGGAEAKVQPPSVTVKW